MAFHRRLLEDCLPFPADTPMHDMWIGLVNQLVGKAGVLREPLMYYRRHGNNTTPDEPSSVMQKLQWRLRISKEPNPVLSAECEACRLRKRNTGQVVRPWGGFCTGFARESKEIMQAKREEG